MEFQFLMFRVTEILHGFSRYLRLQELRRKTVKTSCKQEGNSLGMSSLKSVCYSVFAL